MKKLLLIYSVSALLVLAACNEKKETAPSGRAKKNIESLHYIINAINAGDLSKLDSYFAADITNYGAQTGPIKGLDSVKADLAKAVQHGSDMKAEMIRDLADDDYAMSWVKFTGTMKVDMMGMKAGQKIESTTIELARFNAEGKVVEHWTFMEPREMMKMMGR